MRDVSQLSIKLSNQARRVERHRGQKRDTEERMGNVSFPVLHCDKDLASEHSSLWCPAPSKKSEKQIVTRYTRRQSARQVTQTPLKKTFKAEAVERQSWRYTRLEAPASFSNNCRTITNLPSTLFHPSCFVPIAFVFVLILVLTGLVCYPPCVFK